jgi:hypothetical protein
MTNLLESYLAAIDRQLPGPPRLRHDIIDEVRDGILEAAERRAESAPTEALRHALDEFGPPSVVGPPLVSELRLRLARRAGFVTFAVLAVTGMVWQTYRSLVGFPSSMVPDTAAPAFLAAIDAVTTAPVVAQCGALLFLIASSRRTPSPRWDRMLALIATITLAAIAVTLAATIAAAATIATPYRTTALLAGSVTATVLSIALCSGTWTIRYLRVQP